jgi:hypothetical protein
MFGGSKTIDLLGRSAPILAFMKFINDLFY